MKKKITLSITVILLIIAAFISVYNVINIPIWIQVRLDGATEKLAHMESGEWSFFTFISYLRIIMADILAISLTILSNIKWVVSLKNILLSSVVIISLFQVLFWYVILKNKLINWCEIFRSDNSVNDIIDPNLMYFEIVCLLLGFVSFALFFTQKNIK